MQDRQSRKHWYNNELRAHFIEDLTNFSIMYTWIDKNTQPIIAVRNRTLRGNKMLNLPLETEELSGTVRKHKEEREREDALSSKRKPGLTSKTKTFPSNTLSNPNPATRTLKKWNAPLDSNLSDMRKAKRERIRSNRKSVRKVAQIQQLSVQRAGSAPTRLPMVR